MTVMSLDVRLRHLGLNSHSILSEIFITVHSETSYSCQDCCSFHLQLHTAFSGVKTHLRSWALVYTF